MKQTVLIIIFGLSGMCGYGQTLKEALSKKDTVLALSLIKKGANPNEQDANGTTLLMNACHFPDLATAGFLLRHGVTANQPRSPKGRTALMVACAYWCGTDMVKLLVTYKADVNATANDGTTALMLAASNEKQDVVDYLLAHGANPKARDEKGRTALDFAKAGKVEDYMVTSIKDTRFNRDAVIASLEKAMK
jgi:ankyrin repeat protein